MDNLITIKGTAQIEGMRFYDIEGGFGPGKKAMLAKDIAEIHKRNLNHINEAINNNKERFKDNIHIIDLLGIDLADTEIKEFGFTQQAINSYRGLKAKGLQTGIYILSERGYAVLLKILEDDIAWEQYEKLVDGYFSLRAENKRVRTKPVDTVFRQRLNMARDYARVSGTPLKAALIIGINDAERITGEDYDHWKDLVLTMPQEIEGDSYERYY